MSIKNSLIFCFLSLNFTLFSQNLPSNKKNYALLWEITGNGLTKPSYLFGTMHLRDKRVFEFSDSVLLKLETRDAFASEVRMDSVVYEQWEMIMSGDTTNKLSRQLSKKGYERLLKALKSKGINLDSMESKNTTLVNGLLSDRDESDKEGSKDLFLDLYLTRLAYNQGKSLHGLERLEDYEDLNFSFFQQFEDSTFAQKDTSFMQIIAHFAMIDNMIEVYNSGDLEALQKIVQDTNAFGSRQYRREILAKNGQTIENSTWQRLLKDKSNYYSLLNSLKYDSLLSVVPPQYLDQKDIAEGIILDYLNDEYGEPKAFNFIETQKYKGDLLYVYTCKMDYGDEENNYLIVLCAQPLDKTKYDLETSILLISEAQKDAKGYKKVV